VRVLVKVDVRFRGHFAYVDGHLPDQEVLPLCRLRYGGSASSWGFAIYRASHDDYQPSYLPTGTFSGTPEEGLDCARRRGGRRRRGAGTGPTPGGRRARRGSRTDSKAVRTHGEETYRRHLEPPHTGVRVEKWPIAEPSRQANVDIRAERHGTSLSLLGPPARNHDSGV
jgi:hypothetical protein